MSAGTAETGALALRVLAGPLMGAEATLTPSEEITIGRGFRNLIVLRDPSVGDARVGLTLREGGARLRVLSGAACLLGHRLTAGDEAVLPPYVPLRLGASAVAVGEADKARWREAEALCAEEAALRAPTPTPSPAPARPAGRRLRDLTIGTVAFASLAACTLLLIPGEPAGTPVSETVASALTAAGLSDLAVEETSDGLTVRGTVATDEERAALVALLRGLDQETGTPLHAEVRSGASAARAVSDVFAAAGLSAAATWEAGEVVVRLGEATPADEGMLAALEAKALADLPHVTSLRIEGGTALAPEGATTPFTAQITAVVAGAVPYITTRDGARYFRGAQLPTGGQLVGISAGTITVREDGQNLQYVF